MTLRHTIASICICGLAAIAGPLPAMAQDITTPPEGSVPLLAVELLAIYGNHTWRWGDSGGAYFKTDGRRFFAYSIDGDKQTSVIAEGKWRITDLGKLCFDATWSSDTGSYPATKCFLHAAVGDDIYARTMEEGKGWYLFKHAKTDPSDEFNNLVRGDLASVGGDKSQ